MDYEAVLSSTTMASVRFCQRRRALGVEKTWAAQTSRETLVAFWPEGGIMKWTIRLEAKTGWGEVTTCEIVVLHRSLGDLTADSVGLSLAEAKMLLAGLQQRIVQMPDPRVRHLPPGLPRLPDTEAAARSTQPHPADLVRHREGRRPSHPPMHLRRRARHARPVVVTAVPRPA